MTEFDPVLPPDFSLRVYAGKFQNRSTTGESSRTQKSKNDIFERCVGGVLGYHSSTGSKFRLPGPLVPLSWQVSLSCVGEACRLFLNHCEGKGDGLRV